MLEVSSGAALFHANQAFLHAAGNALDGQAYPFIRLGRVDAVVHQRPPDAQGIKRPAEFGMHRRAARKAVERVSLAFEVKAPEQFDALLAFGQRQGTRIVQPQVYSCSCTGRLAPRRAATARTTWTGCHG